MNWRTRKRDVQDAEECLQRTQLRPNLEEAEDPVPDAVPPDRRRPLAHTRPRCQTLEHLGEHPVERVVERDGSRRDAVLEREADAGLACRSGEEGDAAPDASLGGSVPERVEEKVGEDALQGAL